MLLSPDIQKKAQDELDSVIGRDRLPSFEDRSRLPYVDAVFKEVLRWHPVIPAGEPFQYLFMRSSLVSGYHCFNTIFNWQVFHIKQLKMTSMRASSYLRVSLDLSNILRLMLMHIFPGAVMISNSW